MTYRSLTHLPWFLGALALLPVELIALGSTRPALLWTAASLLLTMGLLCGLTIAGTEWVISRLRPRPLAAASMVALPAAIPLALVARHLFDGGLASTLPGAAWAPLWIPLAGTAALALTLWRARALLQRHTHPGVRLAIAAGLGALAAAAELANRTLYPGGYDDVHAFVTLAGVVAAGTAVCLLRPLAPFATTFASPAAMRRTAAVVAMAVVASFVLVLGHGLQAPADRLIVATRGVHTRQIARVTRLAIDRDGDAHAPVLGGGDCDDGDPARNPGAFDQPGNGRDEDCDGVDPAPLPAHRNQDWHQELAAWRATPAVRAALDRTAGYHVVLVLADALRADVLAPTDENLHDFPNLHALAASSRHFRRAFATASGTDVAIATLLTGRQDPFAPVDTTLLESLSAAGLETHAVLPREVLRWAGKTLIQRGLRSHDRVITDPEQMDVGNHATGHQTTTRGLAALPRVRPAAAHAATTAAAATAASGRPAAAHDRRRFLWLHYFDAHEHHQLQLSDRRLRAALAATRDTAGQPDSARPDSARPDSARPDSARPDSARPDSARPDSARPDTASKYRAAARLVDHELGRLVQALEERGLWDRTIVVLLSDHGESLREDPRLGDTHGRYLYNPLIHIPLLVRIPGVAPAVIDAPVSLLDLPPTLLDLTGAAPLARMSGRTLLPHLLDGAPAALRDQHPPIVLNESDQHGIIDWPYKLLVRPADNLLELYDLEADFGETRNLWAADPARARALHNLYKRYPRVVIDRSRKARQAREAEARPARSK